jgi:hypothetical protein
MTPARTTPVATDLGLKIEGIFIQISLIDLMYLSEGPWTLTHGFNLTVLCCQAVYHQRIFEDRRGSRHGLGVFSTEPGQRCGNPLE